MKKSVFATALVLALTLAMAGRASASVSSLTLDPKAQLSASKIAAVATGTVVCSAGDAANITVVLLQSSGKVDAAATGVASVTCTGTVQSWAVTVNVVIGAALKHGPAVAIVAANDTTDSTFAEFTTDVKLG